MTQSDKELLLKDLCARLPYGVKIKITPNEIIENVESVVYIVDSEYSYISPNSTILNADNIKLLFNDYWKECKPYLLPLSSMTEEQRNEYHELIGGMFSSSVLINFEFLEDFFHKNHLDYRGLISIDLALDATGLNIY